MVGNAAVHHVEDRLHDLQPRGGEGLALDTPGDLVQRFAEAGAEVFFLDEAGHQVGLLGRQLGPKGVGRETAHLAIERIQRLLVIVHALELRLVAPGRSQHHPRGLEIARHFLLHGRHRRLQLVGQARGQMARQRIVFLVIGDALTDARQHPFKHADERKQHRGIEDVERGGIDAHGHRHQREGLLAVRINHRLAGIAAKEAHDPLQQVHRKEEQRQHQRHADEVERDVRIGGALGIFGQIQRRHPRGDGGAQVGSQARRPPRSASRARRPRRGPSRYRWWPTRSGSAP